MRIFDRCMDDDKSALAARMEPIEFPPGAVLIKQGDNRSRAMVVFIASGTAEVWVTIPDPDAQKAGSGKVRGKAQRLITLQAPFYIGEGRLLTGDPASATVRAAGTSASCGFALFRTAFDELFKSHNQDICFMIG